MLNDVSFIWLIIIIVLSLLEIVTSQLVSIWFVLAAVVALIVSLFCSSVIVQILVFVVSTLILLIFTRPLIRRVMSFKKEDTNIGRNIGKKAIVTTDIDNNLGMGQVNIAGMTWTARAVNDKIIKKGTTVIIKSIDGVKLMVDECE